MAGNDGQKYVIDDGQLILIGAATVEQTGFEAGETYEFVASDPCLCRWGAGDATIADGGFTFCVPANLPIRAVCPSGISAVNVIELSAASAATAALAVSKVRVY